MNNDLYYSAEQKNLCNDRNLILSHLYFVRGLEASCQKLNNEYKNLSNEINKNNNYLRTNKVVQKTFTRREYANIEPPDKKKYFGYGAKYFFFGDWDVIPILTFIRWFVFFAVIVIYPIVDLGADLLLFLLVMDEITEDILKALGINAVLYIIFGLICYIRGHSVDRASYKDAVREYKAKKEEDKKSVDEYNQNLQKYIDDEQKRVDAENQRLQAIINKVVNLTARKNFVANEYRAVRNECDRLYSMANFIPKGFRNLYAVYYLYDFMDSSNESFSTALLHCDLNIIKQQLGNIINNQLTIIDNQWKTMKQLDDIQISVDSVANAQDMNNQQLLEKLDLITKGQDNIVKQSAQLAATAQGIENDARIAEANAEARYWMAYARFLK